MDLIYQITKNETPPLIIKDILKHEIERKNEFWYSTYMRSYYFSGDNNYHNYINMEYPSEDGLRRGLILDNDYPYAKDLIEDKEMLRAFRKNMDDTSFWGNVLADYYETNKKRKIKQYKSESNYRGIYEKWSEVVLKYVEIARVIKIKKKSGKYQALIKLSNQESKYNYHIMFIFKYGEQLEQISKVKYDKSFSKDLARLNKIIKDKIGIRSNPIEWNEDRKSFIFHCKIEFVEGQNYKETNFRNTEYLDDGRKDF